MIRIDTQTMYIHEVSFWNIVLKLYEIPTIYVPKPNSIGYKAYKTMTQWKFQNDIHLFVLSQAIYRIFTKQWYDIKLYMKCELKV